MARFLALTEYQKAQNVRLLHVESDVILAPDFPMHSFEKLTEESAFPVISPERGVASILYLRDANASRRLVETMVAELALDPHTSDMLILGKHCLAGHDVCALPIGPNGRDNYSAFTPQKIQDEWAANIERFHGVFDGADVGIFYFGTDPRNSRGISFLQRVIPSEYGDAKKWELKYSEQRNFIDFVTADGIFPLYCLHVTCKQLRMFLFRPPARVIKNRIKKLNRESRKIYIRVGLIQLMFAIQRRALKVIK